YIHSFNCPRPDLRHVSSAYNL
ncbi:unnamed protein product, partial [Allacma fusca]